MKNNLNLLPRPFQRHLIIRNCLLIWTSAGLLVCTLLAAAGYHNHARLADGRSRLKDVEADCVPVRVTFKENQQINRRISELRGRQTLLALLNREYDPLQLVGLVSRSARFVEGELKVASLSYHISQAPAAEQQGDADPRADQPEDKPAMRDVIRLTLDGIAMDDLAVSKFIVALRESGYFRSVELRSSVRSKLEIGNGRKFLVECRL